MYGSQGRRTPPRSSPLRRPDRRGARARVAQAVDHTEIVRHDTSVRRSARRASSAGRGSAPARTRRASSPARRRRAPWDVAPALGRWRCAAAGRRRTRAGSGGGVRVDADRGEHLGGATFVGPSTSSPTSGSATMSATVMRGSSELSGSWKTICTSRRNQRSSCGRPGATGRPPNVTRPRVARSSRGGCGRASTCPNPTHRRCRACRRRRLTLTPERARRSARGPNRLACSRYTRWTSSAASRMSLTHGPTPGSARRG